MMTSRNRTIFRIRRFYDRELRSLLIQHLAVLIIGFSIYLLDDYEQLPTRINLVILVMLAIGKSIYFTWANFVNISIVRVKDKSFNHFLILTGINILLIVLSFALDYYCVNKILPGSISGFTSNDIFGQFVESIYFSIVTFSTTGFGDMTPTNLFARGLVATEIIVAFTATIFVIANYANHAGSADTNNTAESK